jgi:AbrB family looped-hinge helix DNA binding protein
MITTLSTKGQAVIPESIREQARLKTGDKLDVGYINGLVVLRKHVPMTPAQARALIFSGRELPAQTAEDETHVQEAVAAVRRRRHAA